MVDDVNIAVVIPVYNGAGFIARAIASIEAQTLPPREVIVVDDGSQDKTAEVVRAIAVKSQLAIQLLVQPNRGAAAARNACVRAATSDWIAFLDADDEYRPHALARLCDLVRRAPDALLAFGEAQRVNGDAPMGTYIAHRLTTEGRDYDGMTDPPQLIDPVALNLFGAFIAPGTFMVRRDALLTAGPCDEELRRAIDRDMFLRLGMSDPRPWVFTREVLSTIHYTEGSLSSRSNAWRHAEAALVVLEKFRARHAPLNPRLAELVTQSMRKSIATALYWASADGPRQVMTTARHLPRVDSRLRYLAKVASALVVSPVRSRRGAGR